jgi:dolichol-phosphate mannosyltransferase
MTKITTIVPEPSISVASEDSRPRILCILPAFNEAGKIGRVISKVSETQLVDDILVVDDCSTDATGEEARNLGAKVLRHDANAGVGAAIRSGLYYGRENDFDIAVIMSGDDQHVPSELPRVLDPLINSQCDFVQGSRRRRGGSTVNAPLFRELSTRLYSYCFTLFTFQHITDCSNGFRAFRLTMLNELYLLYKAVRSSNTKVIEVPITIHYHANTRDYSKMRPVRDWWRLVRPLFYLRFGIRK